MGLYLKKEDQRSQVQERVAAELQERLRTKASIEGKDHEPTILENQHETRKAGVVIAVLVVIFCIGLVWFALGVSS